jgi:WhiB family transcriptional regulator, redox-sensing transcriptional regulator
MASTAASSWWELAACQSADPEVFFPVSVTGGGLAALRHAQQVCAACLIRQQCLEYALDAGPLQGVWGGTSEEERRTLAVRRRHS